MSAEPDATQLALVRAQVRPARARQGTTTIPAAALPIARVVVDLPHAHLDRLFEYLVPVELSERAKAGVRVQVPFAGQSRRGFIVDRVASPEYTGRLDPIRRVVSAEPVLAAEIAQLARAVADRYAGNTADVLRLAIPPRHARVENEPARRTVPGSLPEPDGAVWSDYPAGLTFLAAVRGGLARRGVLAVRPGADWAAVIATAAASALAGGHGALIAVPDLRDLARMDGALRSVLGEGRHASLSAELGPAERYRRWLAVRRGEVQVVAGTRAAMFAPVRDLGLVVIWDDGDDLHAEPRAPYPHVREVICMRAQQAGAAALIAGYAITPEAAQLVQSGWARYVSAQRARVRGSAPRIRAVADNASMAADPGAATARLPSIAWEAAQQSLAGGAPVLVQVPRSGYLPGLACRNCRAPARCAHCSGPLGLSSGHAVAACHWCGRPAGRWTCPHCEGRNWRAQVVGAARTAEELGRAFPSVPVLTSGGERVLDAVAATPSLTVATPGAEPVAAGGYGAALLLDGWALLGRPDLRATEETLRRWMGAAALVRPATQGGTVVVMADGALPVVQALIRWDPASVAERELAERTSLGFPPAARIAALTGAASAVSGILEGAQLPSGAEILGPVALGRDGNVRTLVRVPRTAGGALAAALHRAQGVRSARKDADVVRVQIDPLDLG